MLTEKTTTNITWTKLIFSAKGKYKDCSKNKENIDLEWENVANGGNTTYYSLVHFFNFP